MRGILSASPNRSDRFLSLVPGILSALLIFNASPANADRNPSLCTNPSVALRIREFFDQNDDGVPDSLVPNQPNTQKQAGDIVLYQAALSHSGTDNCGYEDGVLCIDLPGIGCPAANPAVATPSYATTVVGPGECCDATVRTGPVPLVCDPAVCVPPGTASHASDFIRYVVNTDDVQYHGRCATNELRANAYYDEGHSHQAPVDVIPATASIPICNPTGDIPRQHFMCYESEKVHAQRNVSLVDRFGSLSNVFVGPLKRICNPADKNDEDATVPPFPADTNHLTFYEITTPTFASRTVRATNQFGSADLQLLRATRLMVPTAKGPIPPAPGSSAPPPPNPPTIDHYECYTVQGPTTDRVVTIDDQFGHLSVNVRRADWACVPANKNNEGFVNPDGALGPGFVCYDVRTTPARQTYKGTYHFANQFNVTTKPLDVHGPRELCVQSTIDVL